MIKLKLTDPTKKEKEVKEYVIDERGAVALYRNYGFSWQNGMPNWMDYREKIESRVIGYLPLNFTRSTQDGTIRSNTNLFSIADKPAIGLVPLVLSNGLFNVEAEIPSLAIEDLIYDFDVHSIPPEA